MLSFIKEIKLMGSSRMQKFISKMFLLAYHFTVT